MQGDPFRDAPQGKPERAPLKTHDFGWDPFERLRLARKGGVGVPPIAFPKRLALGVGAAAIAVVALSGTAMLGAGDSDAQTASAESSLVAREAQLKQREDRIAELERRRDASQAEIKDSEKRVADLERRRADLQREVAELTAPVAPAGDEAEVPPSPAPTDQSAAVESDDPSPPVETDSDDATISASSRAGADDARPSTAEVEPAAADQPQPVAESADEQSGPVRVYIHVRSADAAARERAEAVAAELRRRGVTVAQIRGVMRPVSHDAVRFYYDADRKAVSALQDAVRLASPLGGSPQPQDFRGYRAPPKRGTLELWLS